jgi:transposase-like protein
MEPARSTAMSNSKRSRRQFTTEQKVAILKRHMVDKVPVSNLCDELGLQPSVVYHWQKQMLENSPVRSRRRLPNGPSKGEKEQAHELGKESSPAVNAPEKAESRRGGAGSRVLPEGWKRRL